ncbi:hypothetical protein L227DRAFT_618066 [Lentinus tigrinus ALCF2SS1-6]|uniref:Uncharacterized protein n=1 Tax=Lentinus tigrinus ALCF2SS1-6 TaxID=1328759 RepID=A0A5C2RLD6_9APHY|nr:hypothetical protein L227DRAFT_618066 [Lentinus tigrinus ALCF2SS1-6]
MPPKLPDAETRYLEERLPDFRRTGKNDRTPFLEACAKRLVTLQGIPEGCIGYDLHIKHFVQIAWTWFNNRIQKNKDRATRLPIRINRSWTGERVFEFMKNSDIREAVREDEPNHQHHIVAWNLMRRSLWEDLEEDEREDYAALATQWNRNGPDVKLQPRMAARRALGWMRSTCKMYWEQCGMALFLYGVWPDEDGELNTLRYDTSDYVAELAGKDGRKLPRFTARPDWEKNIRAAAEQFFGEWYSLVAGTSVRDHSARKGPVEFQFARYDDGTPILTDTEDGKPFTVERAQEVLRQYIRINYRHTGQGRAMESDCAAPGSLLRNGHAA